MARTRNGGLIVSLNGFLDLGTALSGTAVVTPPSGTNYAPQPVSFTVVPGGGQLNDTNCVFGPVSGSWGTLTVFGVTDGSGTALATPGTLLAPFTPVNGQLVAVPPGNISLFVGAQVPIEAGTVASGLVGTGSGWVTALLLPAQTNITASVPSGTGFRLPAVLPGNVTQGTVTLQNNDPANAAPVYPPVGTSGRIGFGGTTLASGTPFLVGANGGRISFSTNAPAQYWAAG